MVFCGSPLIHVSFAATNQWASPKTPYGRFFPRHNSSLIGRKNQAKFENDCISGSGHRFNITQPNLMILVSFSSAEDALSNDVKKYDIFLARKVLKIRRSAFFGGHPVYMIFFLLSVHLGVFPPPPPIAKSWLRYWLRLQQTRKYTHTFIVGRFSLFLILLSQLKASYHKNVSLHSHYSMVTCTTLVCVTYTGWPRKNGTAYFLLKKVEWLIHSIYGVKKFHSLSSKFHSILTPEEWKFTTQQVESRLVHSIFTPKRSDHWYQYPGSENRVKIHSIFF